MKISKFIPVSIKVKSLYWSRMEKFISMDLDNLFKVIDEGDEEPSRKLIEELRGKWVDVAYDAPDWFHAKWMTQFTRAETILVLF